MSPGKLVIFAAAPLIAAAQQPALPHFDAASLKLAIDQSILAARPTRTPGRFRWTTQLAYLLGYAYRMEWWRISGDLAGFGAIYQLEATHDPKASEEQLRLMLQALLTERFKMVSHRTTKEVDGYALSVAKNGPKMEEAKEGEIPPLPEWMRGPGDDPAAMEERVVATMPSRGVGIISGRRVTMLQLSETLQRLLDTAVLDQTGLTSRYYFAFRYAMESNPEIPYPTLAGAVKDLGLRFERRKGPAEMLVIDQMERIPVEN